MPVTAMAPVWICHTSKCFYFGVYMFNHNPPDRKLSVICLLLFAQLMVLTRLYRNTTVCMICSYPKVSKIGVKGYRFADPFSNRIFIYLEIMLAAFPFLYVYDFQSIPLYYNLRLQRMALFFPE
jgi:hypothetical protein